MTEKEKAYRDAVEREQTIRETCFLGLPEMVGGFELRPLTIRDYLTLVGIGSPFVAGGRLPEPADVGVFLWFQSTAYEAKNERARKRFYRRVIAAPVSIIGDIHQFVADSMTDRPSTKGSSGGKSYYSWCASVVNVIAREYGWTDEYIINRPLKALWQYVKCIKSANNPKAMLFNASDHLLGEWVKELNEQNKKKGQDNAV